MDKDEKALIITTVVYMAVWLFLCVALPGIYLAP